MNHQLQQLLGFRLESQSFFFRFNGHVCSHLLRNLHCQQRWGYRTIFSTTQDHIADKKKGSRRMKHGYPRQHQPLPASKLFERVADFCQALHGMHTC